MKCFLSISNFLEEISDAKSCPTLCDPIDGSPLGSPVPGILQARTLENSNAWTPMHESEKWKWSRSVVSDPQRPHGLQPSRLLHPWDFPGKSTGVGCHCLLQSSVYSLIHIVITVTPKVLPIVKIWHDVFSFLFMFFFIPFLQIFISFPLREDSLKFLLE